MKKNVVSLIGILVVMSLTACSSKPETSEGDVQNVQTEQEADEAERKTETMADDLPKRQGEISQSETTATENDNQDKAIELYVKALRNYIAAGKTDFTVSFIDLDDDSTREMVVFFGESQADGGYLFTIRNEEAIQVLSESGDCFGQYGGFTYKEKGNVFVTENESVTEAQSSNQIFYYTMENGNAVCIDMTQSITQFDSGESRFYVNDTEVESEKFNSIAEKYGLLEMSTVSYADGVPVMDGQMDMVYNAYHNVQTDTRNDIAQTSKDDDKFIDYEALGIKEYEYPSEFIMGDNLKTALAELAIAYVSFDSDTPKNDGGFQEYFITKFIQNSRLSFDYLDLISEQNNGQISIEELNYMQYSLTNTELDFSSVVNGFVDRYDAASPIIYGLISEYDYKNTDNGAFITADLEVGYDGMEDTQKYEVMAELVRNPYSCFDGYSIVTLSSTIADNMQGDTNLPADEVGTDLYEGEYCSYDVNEPYSNGSRGK